MIPHRAKLALVAAACCALASCLDAKVNVPVSVMPVDKNHNAQAMKDIRLTLFKALAPLDEHDPQYARCSGEWSETQLTDLDGKTTFSLLPGDYEICSEEQTYNNEKFKWGVPFRVTQDGLKVPRLIEDAGTFIDCARAEQRVRLLMWKYAGEKDGQVNELLLSRDNALDQTQTPQPTPTPCSTPTPSPASSPTAQGSPSTQATSTGTPATTNAASSPAPATMPTTAGSPAATPTPATNPSPAPVRVTGGSRRLRRAL